MAEQHKGSDGKIRCPCVKCVNNKRHTPVDVRGHILRWGFQTSYEQWVFHGEEEVNVADVIVDENDVDEMRDVINDFFTPACDDNTPSVDGNRMGEYYDELFKDIEAELYPGCNWISSLNFLAKLMHLKIVGGISNNIFDV
uniref:Transposase-associated domain-containing protein n=1 Tax=Cannabis sativa TaxID=3483 RepID=A0A803Q230_CANSA